MNGLVLVLGLMVAQAQATGPGGATNDEAHAAASAAVVSAEALLAAGRPYAASRELARYLSTSDLVAPEAVLLTAEALFRTRSWTSVRRLLVDQPWLDEVNDGTGRLTLALATLEAGDAAEAIESFELYINRKQAAEARAEQLVEARVGYARALSLGERHADAATEYERAAETAPTIRSWLLLSALQQASLAGEPELAARLSDSLAASSVVPEDSILVPFVLSAFRAGDPVEGLARARRLDRAAYRMLVGEFIGPALEATGPTGAATAAYRDALASSRAGPEAGEALIRLEPGWTTLVEIAASDRAAGRDDRASRLLTQAIGQAPEVEIPGLWVELARARFDAGDYYGTLRAVEQVVERSEFDQRTRAELLLLRARSTYRTGRRTAARPDFERSARVSSSGSSAFAAFVVADMAHDEGALEEAAAWYAEIVMRFPRSMHAETALMRLGLIAFQLGDAAAAVDYFDTYRRRFPNENWFQAATYWSARSHEAAEDTAGARSLYVETIGYAPVSFYGIQAARRIGVQAWDELTLRPQQSVPELAESYVRLIDRMNLLARLGWPERARREYRRFRFGAGEAAAQLLALSLALQDAGWTSEGVALGWEVHRRKGGQWSEPLMRAIYPLPYRDALVDAAHREGLDPGFVAGLARQESVFDREIVSPAGAIGLMQLMPRTAAGLAGETGMSEFRTDQLVVAEINMELGSRYLASLLRRFRGSRTAALMSYNAGPHRFVRWREFPEYAVDEELFIERIPFAETRRYVKNVEANAYIYRRLYDL